MSSAAARISAGRVSLRRRQRGAGFLSLFSTVLGFIFGPPQRLRGLGEYTDPSVISHLVGCAACGPDSKRSAASRSFFDTPFDAVKSSVAATYVILPTG